ncbi:MAG: GNAT family N-acetyltransferase [Planctomycetota bacterium]
MPEAQILDQDIARKITRRPVTDDDLEFLHRLYESTRWDLDLLPLNDEQKKAFVDQQFNAQHTHYHKFFAGADFDIVLLNDRPVGRIYVWEGKKEVRVVDISMLPEFRGSGIGGTVMQQAIDQAARADKPLRLWVESVNPARQWYEKTGFHVIEDKGINQHMELPAPSNAT